MKFEDFLVGTVELELQPQKAEDVINEAINQNLTLTNIYQKKGRLYVQVPLEQFWDFSHLLRHRQERFHIARRRGLPFFISRLKRRRGLLLGGFFTMAIVYLLLSFVWGYEVSGNEQFSEEYIIALVQQYGVIPGAKIEGFDYAEIQDQFIIDHHNFSWISIRPRGTTVVIKVKERLLNEPVDERPASLIANQDGVVKELLVFRGTPLVQRETAVHKGQVLIGGWEYPERTRNEMGVYEKTGEPELVPAKGVIYGEVQHEAVGVCFFEEQRLEETGASQKQYRIQLANHSLKLWGPKETPYENNRQERITKNLFHWKNYKVPIDVIRTTFYEQRTVQAQYTREDAIKIAIERGRAKLRSSISGAGQEITFLNEQLILLSEAENQVQVQVVWTVEENLAEVKLLEAR